MGCCNQKGIDETISEVFDSLPLRNVYIKTFSTKFDEITSKRELTETAFKQIMELYLIPSKGYYENLEEYWLTFYRCIQPNQQYYVVKFCLMCFTNYNNYDFSDINMFVALVCEEEVKRAVKTETMSINYNNMMVPRQEMITLLSYFINLNTVNTINFFKHYWYDSEGFEKKKQKEWDSNIVNLFIFDYFLKNLDVDPQEEKPVPIKDFFTNHLFKIKNDKMLRLKFAEFSLQFNGEKEYEVNEKGERITIYQS